MDLKEIRWEGVDWIYLAQLVEAVSYKPDSRGFDSRWDHWDFSLTFSFQPHYDPGVDSDTNKNEYQTVSSGR